jgi:hypothetical protein
MRKLKLLTMLLVMFIAIFSITSNLFKTAAQTDEVNWQYKGASIPGYFADAFASEGNVYLLVGELQATGVNTITLIVNWYQEEMTSTGIAPDPVLTVHDADLIALIDYIKANNLQVVLKPHLEVAAGGWRGLIDPADNSAWFDAYSEFARHYAEIAAQHGVDLLCIGTEQESMTRFDRVMGWSTVVDAVRQVYDGNLTYGATMGEISADHDLPQSFWDMFDYASVTVYPRVSDAPTPSVEEMLNGWYGWVIPGLEPLHTRYGKEVIFAEIGFRSVDSVAVSPWVTQGANFFSTTYSSSEGKPTTSEGVVEDETITVEIQGLPVYDGVGQANAYEAFFRAMGEVPWMAGAFLWQFEPNPACQNFESGEGGIGYTVLGKPAAQVVHQWFGGAGSPPSTSLAVRDSFLVDSCEFSDDAAVERTWRAQTSGTVRLYAADDNAPGSAGQWSMGVESSVPPDEPRYMQLVRVPCTGAQDWTSARALTFWLKMSDPYQDLYGGEVSVVMVDTNEQQDERWQYSQWLPSNGEWMHVCIPLDPDPEPAAQLSPWEGGFTVPDWHRVPDVPTNLVFERDHIREIWLSFVTTGEDAANGYTDITAWVDDLRLLDTVPSECLVATVDVPSANLRSGPGTDYYIAGGAQLGDRLFITGQANDYAWYRVQNPGGDAVWVADLVVEVRANLQQYIEAVTDFAPPPPPLPQNGGQDNVNVEEQAPVPVVPTETPAPALWIEGAPASTAADCIDIYVMTRGLGNEQPYVTVSNVDGTWEQPGVTSEGAERWKSRICLGKVGADHTVTVTAGGLTAAQVIHRD